MSTGSRVTKTETEPWQEVRPYLQSGFGRVEDLYSTGKLTPDYYPDPTLAPFAPAQQAAQTATIDYLTGDRAKQLMAGAEATTLGGMGYGLGAMGYGGQMAQPLSTLGYSQLTPFSQPQYEQMLSGEVDMDQFGAISDVYRREAQQQLEENLLPGIRQSMVQYQPGGGSRGDIVQGLAIDRANQRVSDNIAKAMFGAQTEATKRQLAAGQMGLQAQQYGMGYGLQGADATRGLLGMYPSIMGAPIDAYAKLGGVGAQQRAMEQAEIDRDMARYQYQANLPRIGLQNYMAGLSGEYGGQTTTTGPGMNPLGAIIGALAGNVIPGISPIQGALGGALV